MTFNSSLLAKQDYRILNSPNSLLHKVLKHIYFAHKDLLTATAGTKPSYGWSSTLHGRDLLNKGLRWHIGEGNIRAFVDMWIMAHPPRAAASNSLNPDTLVKNLLYHGQWDETKISQINIEYQHEISKIYVPQNRRSDKLIWHNNKDEIYNVKSGYWLVLQGQNFGNSQLPRD